MDATVKWTLLLQVSATLAMVGLIWFVQIVHYPLLAKVGRDAFRRYELDHQRLTTWVVAPLMLTEAITAAILVWSHPVGVSSTLLWAGFGLLISIWAMTYLVQVPQHASLVLAYDVGLHRRLVLGNWYRTLAWSLRGVLVIMILGQLLGGFDAMPTTQIVGGPTQ